MSQLIQSGNINKPGKGNLVIDFPVPFNGVPTVVVSPYWQGSTTAVTEIETITAITPYSFTITSGNYGPGYYFVTWVAVGN
jgi:hypothetical protein